MAYIQNNWGTDGTLRTRVRRLAYVAYGHTLIFIGARMILDMRTFTRMLVFYLFFKVSKIFLVLIILYCLKAYCYIFDLQFICLALEDTDSLLFKFVLKKPYFSNFYTNYLINIYPYLRALSNLECQYENKLKWLCICKSLS